MEADVSPSVSSVGYPPSEYLLAAQSYKKGRVTMEGNGLPAGMLDQVDILALNEDVQRDEFAEFIDHMIHLL